MNNFVFTQCTEGHDVHEAVVVEAVVKIGVAGDVGHSEWVAVAGNS